MTDQNDREKEIEKAADELVKYHPKDVNYSVSYYFKAGAKWADENPINIHSIEEMHELSILYSNEIHKVETLRQQLAIAKEALENVQWNGKESYNRSFAKSCPSCKGICLEDITVDGWIKEAVGHKQDCKLKLALAQISELEK